MSIYCVKVKGNYNKLKIYKFGFTTNSIRRRMYAYSGLNTPDKFICNYEVSNPAAFEKKILKLMKKMHQFRFIKELGKEWFTCDDEKFLCNFIQMQKNNVDKKKEIHGHFNLTWNEDILTVLDEGCKLTSKQIFEKIQKDNLRIIDKSVAKTPGATCSALCGNLVKKGVICQEKNESSPIKYFVSSSSF